MLRLHPAYDDVLIFDSNDHADVFMNAATYRHLHTEFDLFLDAVHSSRSRFLSGAPSAEAKRAWDPKRDRGTG
jgi:hypothetical protein